MARIKASRLFEVPPEEDDRKRKQYLRKSREYGKEWTMIATHDAVVQSVPDPKPELSPREERITLAEHVELRIPIEDTRRNKLIKDTDHQRRKHCEDDVV